VTEPRPIAPSPISGIVLAGGRATRFGRDKLAEPLRDQPLLHHALQAIAPLVDEILVVTRPHGAPPRLPSPAQLGRPIRLVRDPEPYGGPLVALAAGLEATDAAAAIFVGGDMPALRPAVLRALLAELAAGGDVVLLEGPGPVQTMPAALRVATAREAARVALAGGSRALRACYDRLRLVMIPESAWRALDPDAATLRDVDTPADLERER
jgi:molybdopterin-guanine dinucleotide biosynthesis protein A